MLIRGGEKLYLEDLDRCLEEHASVAEACSVQVSGLFGFERAVTFLVPRGAVGTVASQVEEAIRAHVRGSQCNVDLTDGWDIWAVRDRQVTDLRIEYGIA